MNKLMQKYNREDSLLIISPYPKKGELYSAGISGVASYTKNVVRNMKRRVIVLADYKEKPTIYEEGNALVVRCFRLNTLLMWPKLLKELRHFSEIKTILIQFDFAIYGGVLTSSLVLPFLLILKLLSYQTSVVLHHVILDVKKLSGHIGLGTGIGATPKAVLYNSLFKLFYRLLAPVASRIIVLEEVLKERLATVVPREKIATIPHGVDADLKKVDKTIARKLLGIGLDEYVVLFFGFVNWFKGADIFVETFEDKRHLLGRKARFLLAGGESPTLRNKMYYQRYFQQVQKLCKQTKAIDITGYVPQEKIPLYFSCADVVVFPYRHFMTASGVLSLVFSYMSPFVVSRELSDMFDAPDLLQALSACGLTKNDLVFELNKSSFIAKTEKVLTNGLRKRMTRLSHIIRQERSYQNTALIYQQLLFAQAPSLSQRLALSYTK